MIEVIDGIEMKYCPRCEEHVPVEGFYKHKTQSDGLAGYCKTCWRKYTRNFMSEWRDNNREHYNQQQREYYENNREYINQQKREYLQSNPDKHHQKLFAVRLNMAIYAGKIIKPDECTLCHSIENIQGHHPSYEPGHELDVIWVCALCHAKIHMQLRHEEENGGPILD